MEQVTKTADLESAARYRKLASANTDKRVPGYPEPLRRDYLNRARLIESKYTEAK